jgi:hypothetical protein
MVPNAAAMRSIPPWPNLARVSGDEPFTARRPFDAEVVPARLVAGLRPPPA